MAGNGAPRLLRLPTAATSLPLLQLAGLLQLLCLASALNQDGTLLLSFKLSLAADPLGSLSGWGYADATPCAWNSVVCSPDSRVVSVVLPNAQHVDARNVLSPTCSAARRGAVRLGRSFC